MRKREILEELAGFCGAIDIALARMTPDGALKDIRETCELMRELVAQEAPDIWVSGDGFPDVDGEKHGN